MHCLPTVSKEQRLRFFACSCCVLLYLFVFLFKISLLFIPRRKKGRGKRGPQLGHQAKQPHHSAGYTVMSQTLHDRVHATSVRLKSDPDRPNPRLGAPEDDFDLTGHGIALAIRVAGCVASGIGMAITGNVILPLLASVIIWELADKYVE